MDCCRGCTTGRLRAAGPAATNGPGAIVLSSAVVPCREAGTGLPAASPYAVGVKGPGEITITALSKLPFLRPLVPWSDSNEVGACRRPLTVNS